MRPGVRLSIDVGTVRIGVARSDATGFLATPLTTVQRRDDGTDVAELVKLVLEEDAIEVIAGLPRALSGRSTASTDDAVAFARRLATTLATGVNAVDEASRGACVDSGPGSDSDSGASHGDVPVRLVDERFSTVTASRSLSAGGKSAKQQRNIIDRTAAAVILQHALDSERASGRPAGVLITQTEDLATSDN